MRQICVVVIIALLGASGLCVESSTNAARVGGVEASGNRVTGETTLALTGVTVIDGTGSTPSSNQTIVIRGSRIVDIHVTGARTLPAEAIIRALPGRYVMPGLIDTHVHLATRPRDSSVLHGMLRVALLGGVTTVRDMGGSLSLIEPLAARAKRGADSPMIYYSAIISGPGTMWFQDSARARFFAGDAAVGSAPVVRLVRDGDDPAAIVRAARAAGATGIKLYSGISPIMVQALSREAHRMGLRVWAHAWVPPGSPLDLLRSGVDVVSHADQPVWTRYGGDSIGTREARLQRFRTLAVSSPEMQEYLQALRVSRTTFEPTLFVMAPSLDQLRNPAAADSQSVALFRWAAALTAEASRTGVAISAGTDDIVRGNTPNIHGEIQMLVNYASLTPLQAITAATSNAAHVIGISDSVGVLAPGKMADLLVLRANPASDIRNTQTIEAVIHRGRWIERTAGWNRGPNVIAPDSL